MQHFSITVFKDELEFTTTHQFPSIDQIIDMLWNISLYEFTSTGSYILTSLLLVCICGYTLKNVLKKHRKMKLLVPAKNISPSIMNLPCVLDMRQEKKLFFYQVSLLSTLLSWSKLFCLGVVPCDHYASSLRIYWCWCHYSTCFRCNFKHDTITGIIINITFTLLSMYYIRHAYFVNISDATCSNAQHPKTIHIAQV